MTSAATDPVDPTGPAGLDARIQEALDGLLPALELEPRGGDRFAVKGEPGRFVRTFGGQTVAQALLATAATAPGRVPGSMHAYFVSAGEPGRTLELDVERVRDGRSVATRRVSVHQGDRVVLTALASFDDTQAEPRAEVPPPTVPGPDELPRLQDWVAEMTDDRPHVDAWTDTPPPVEMRMGERPSFMGGASSAEPRPVWLRFPRDLGDDQLLHSALLAYASDYLLLDTAMRAHPGRQELDIVSAASLDHSIWFHRPARVDRWLVHTQTTEVVGDQRGLVRGTIHDLDGHLVASTAQATVTRFAPRGEGQTRA